MAVLARAPLGIASPRLGFQHGARSVQCRALCLASSSSTMQASSSSSTSTTAGEPLVTNKIFRSPMKVRKVETMEPSEWRTAGVVKVEDVAEGVRCITVDAECSREFVPIENAYTRPGQLAQVRFSQRQDCIKVCVSCPPFPSEANYAVTIKSRGDIPAGTTKLAQYYLSVRCPLELHVLKSENQELYDLKEGDEIEIGPFDNSTALDLRPVLFLSRFPSMLFFAYGKGIAVARAIINAREGDDSSLSLKLRRDVRLYYSAQKPSLIAYKDDFENWERTKRVKVCTIVQGTEGKTDWEGQVGDFQDLWDEDDVEYDPRTTAVILCSEKQEMGELEQLAEKAEFEKDQVIKWAI